MCLSKRFGESIEMRSKNLMRTELIWKSMGLEICKFESSKIEEVASIDKIQRKIFRLTHWQILAT